MDHHLLSGLRPIRRARRLKLNEIAPVIGVKPNSYARFEAGDRRIYFDKAVMLAKRLGVRTDDLIAPLTDDAAAILCDERDKAAIASGTYDRFLNTPGTLNVSVPPPPAAQVPAPPGSTDIVVSAQDDADAAAELSDWSDAE